MGVSVSLGGPERAANPRWATWVGWVLGLGPIGLLAFTAGLKLTRQPQVLEVFVGHFGYPESALLPIAVAELSSAVLYAIPRTAVLGAIVLTGYMGGAIATHARLGEPILMQAGVGVLAWAGLFLRDPRLRALLPVVRG